MLVFGNEDYGVRGSDEEGEVLELKEEEINKIGEFRNAWQHENEIIHKNPR